MPLGNTDDEYGAVARLFHWLTAFIIFGLIPLGLYMQEVAYGPEKLQLYVIHKSFGFLALFIVIGRIAWRFLNLPPSHLETHAPWERFLAGVTHFFLYAAVIGMPMSGWIMSSAAEYPVPFFGFDMPNLVGKDETIYKIAGAVHGYLAYALIMAVGLHVAGAFKHHFIDKDSTLMRMSFLQSRAGAFVLAIIVVAFFAGVGYLIVKPGTPGGNGTGAEQTGQAVDAGAVDLTNLGEHGWAIVPGASKVEFQAKMGGTPFTGSFGKFTGTIVFNPNDLPNSKATITIDTATATTSNKERDEQIGAADWFNTGMYPTATYDTIAIEKGDGDHYIAVGNLTIRGVTHPVTMPFTVTFGKNKDGQNTATMKGTAQISRLDFGVGQGQWATEETVAGPVAIAVTVNAVRP